MLDPDARKKVITWVRAHDSGVADDLAAAFTEREHAVEVARGIAKDQDLKAFLDKVAATMERFVAVEEQRVALAKAHEARWQAILGQKGLIAALISAAVTLGGIALHAEIVSGDGATGAPAGVGAVSAP